MSVLDKTDEQEGARSDPAGPTRPASYELPDLSEVEAAHTKLMGGYVGALEVASRLGRGENEGPGWAAVSASLRGREEQKKFSEMFLSAEDRKKRLTELGLPASIGSAGLVRLLLGAHVRRRLEELGECYLQLATAIDQKSGATGSAWLDGARERCMLTAASLPSLRIPRAFGLASLISLVTGAIAKASDLPSWIGTVLLILAFPLAISVVVGYITVRDSYRTKRALLLPNAARIDGLDPQQQKTTVKGNVYAVEDDLFTALRRGKRRERQLDRILEITAWIAVLYLVSGVSALVPTAPWWLALIFFLVLVGGMVIASYRVIKMTPRTWR